MYLGVIPHTLRLADSFSKERVQGEISNGDRDLVAEHLNHLIVVYSNLQGLIPLFVVGSRPSCTIPGASVC